MPYTDPEKRKQATKDRVRRYRDRQKGVTQTKNNVTPDVTPPVNPIIFQPYSKETQLAAKMSKAAAKKEATFAELKDKYDYRK